MELSPLTLLVLLVFALLVAASLAVWTAFGSMRASDEDVAPERARNLFVREDAQAEAPSGKEGRRGRTRGSSARTAAADSGGGARGKGARIFEAEAGEARGRKAERVAAGAANTQVGAEKKSEPQPRPKRRGQEEDAFERFLRGQPDDTDFR